MELKELSLTELEKLRDKIDFEILSRKEAMIKTKKYTNYKQYLNEVTGIIEPFMILSESDFNFKYIFTDDQVEAEVKRACGIS
jgi:hypothetical protein